MANKITNTQYYSDIADAIRAKTGSQSTYTPAQMAPAIAAITGSVTEKDVNFYDYDGTLVKSYTTAEFLQLQALPENPTHEGLTAQGWNWTLADAQIFVQANGLLDIGQIYNTSDGKTRIYITLPSGRLAPYLGLRINGSIDIDWGDGSTHDTATGNGTAVSYVQHTYSQPGDYVIAIDVSSGGFVIIEGVTADVASLLLSKAGDGTTHAGYRAAIKKIHFGDRTRLGQYALAGCTAMEYITVTNHYPSDYNSWFNGCRSLKFIALPYNVSPGGDWQNCSAIRLAAIRQVQSSGFLFNKCSALVRAILPSCNTIGDYCFRDCADLQTVIAPLATSVAQYGFNSCYCLKTLKLGTVTTIGKSAFLGCSSLDTINLGTVTQLQQSALQACSTLRTLTIPATVTSIAATAIEHANSLVELHVLPTNPPTLNATGLRYLAEDCTIYVPSASLETYKGATNWATFATQMVGE